MLLTLAVSCVLVTLASSACVDKVGNLITVEDINDPSLDIHLEGIQLGTYDANGAPTCDNNEAGLRLPGIIKILGGKIKVTAANDLTKMINKNTLKKNSWLIGTVCEDGIAKNPIIPTDACQFDGSNLIPESLRKLLSTPGEYDMSTIEQQLGIDNTIQLPAVGPAIKSILKGEWQGAVDVVNGGNKVITNVRFPSNTKWLYIE